MVMFYAFVALCFTSTAMAQIAGFGPCPKVETMPDFELAKLHGKWHEAQKYFATFEMHLKCVNSYYRNGENDTMLLDGSAISKVTGKVKTVEDINVRMADPAEPGKLKMKTSSMHFWRDIWILGTDYHNYMVAYNCIDLKLINFKYLWISARKQHPSNSIIENAHKVIEKQNLSLKHLITTDQLDCVVKPDSDEDDDSEEFNMLF